MIKSNEQQDIQSILQQISDVLLMNGGFLGNPGLYNGDMGLALFFARYARYTKNDFYLDYCYGLMEKLQTRIHRETTIDYKQGLSGIGATIEYLVQNGYFEADTDEILEDFDRRIFFTYNLSYLAIDEIKDVGYYASWRLSGNSSQKEMIRQAILPQIENYSVFSSLCNKAIPNIFIDKTHKNCLELIDNNDFWRKDMGIMYGLAGWGISLLTELDGDNSWFPLFPNDFNIINK